ncbi:uncharacterized protein [Penaeus vannamei]|uniref:uncharacterized protein n=1 Tax=Penaeus vannamei TaxID=6689 RepID=UPI00387F3BA2
MSLHPFRNSSCISDSPKSQYKEPFQLLWPHYLLITSRCNIFPVSMMRYMFLVACIVCLCHVAPSDALKPTDLLAPFYVERLARIFMDKLVAFMMALKGLATIALAIIGILDRKKNGRSFANASDSQALLFSTLRWMDTQACVPKMLCQLDLTAAATRTPEENKIVEVLTNNLDSFSHHANASALRPEVVDLLTRDPEADVCGALFSQCPIEGKLMRDFLQLLT